MTNYNAIIFLYNSKCKKLTRLPTRFFKAIKFNLPNQLRKEINTLEEKNKAQNSKLEDTIAENGKLKTSIESTKNAYSELEEKVASLEKSATGMEESKATFQAEMQKLVQKYQRDTLKYQVDEKSTKETQIQELMQAKEELNQKIQDIQINNEVAAKNDKQMVIYLIHYFL